ncbi:EamA-like transporter family protein [Tepidimonas alkaliphilus]|uniref:EamA-like transporter family protein n=2 Tax=Tepidimonas alkaliphilus TaxID=2588942 RepID=A0A554W6N5_9BURK|nr:EamA-like transporter family protein [Tepidimonas alkaliphilus]
MWGVNGPVMKLSLQELSPLSFHAVTMTGGALLAAAFEPWPRGRFSPRMWGLLAYGVFMNDGFAQIIWFSLARHLPPATRAMSMMMVPLIGTARATVIAGEWPRWTGGVAVVCVMAAIAAVLAPPAAWRRFSQR